MPPIDRDSALDQLYAAAPADFVAERKRLARELREGGDRQGAAEIAKWPKPSPVAWALNAAARDDDERLGDWLAAAGALRDASASPGDGDALRAAMAAHRTATAGLLKAVAERAQLSAAMLDRVRALLQAATADAALAGTIEAGRVDEERGEDAPAGTSRGGGAGTRETTRLRKGKSKDKAMGSGEVDVDHQAELDRQAEQERQAELERQAEEERQAELDRQLAAASATLDERREESDAAKASVAAAEERVEEAERTLRRSRSEASAARATAKEADRALAQAERLLDTLRSRRSA